MFKRLVFFLVTVFIVLSANSQVVHKGVKAPDFKLYNLKGNSSTLKTYSNKVVVIKMWFTTCAPCIQEISKVNKVVEKYKNREDIVFLAPAPNSKKTLKKFLRKADFDYEVMSGSYEMLKVYNPVRRYPSHVIIDKKGVVSFVLEGSSENIDEILTTEIEKVL
ncbi:Peroxiredoxin [Lutibacter oricola]|uniref:Peroxiredoxin n=1 Tax=Lutibacter oricola TaxID=762486 RepID=A0A1H3D2M0_9FLAO|nr:TlpA disulfide reductase family protein [Lutibacter oricola]SDX60713.1 Peroxiredoxin [Lutibacter oricola]